MNPLDELTRLTSLFPKSEPLFESVQHIPSGTVLEPYRSLLVHEHHMTVTMEKFHGCAVNVVVLKTELDGDIYKREILLTREDNDVPVQYGIVRFDFQYITQPVRDELIAGKIPLGRVLINHNVLRHIDHGPILELSLGASLAEQLQAAPGATTYGRMATIFCNGHPALDLLEVSVPLEAASS